MPRDDRKIRRMRQFSIDGRQAGYLVQEIVLINESWLSTSSFHEHVCRGLPVPPDIEVMPGMFDGALAAAATRQTLNVLELIEGWAFEFDLGHSVRHSYG